MAFADITSTAVLQAVAEFDRLGRDAFLARYGFRPAREYYLHIESRLYDSKAIMGAAHGYQCPGEGPLRAEDFTGGYAKVQRKLERLGFTVSVLKAAGT